MHPIYILFLLSFGMVIIEATERKITEINPNIQLDELIEAKRPLPKVSHEISSDGNQRIHISKSYSENFKDDGKKLRAEVDRNSFDNKTAYSLQKNNTEDISDEQRHRNHCLKMQSNEPLIYSNFTHGNCSHSLLDDLGESLCRGESFSLADSGLKCFYERRQNPFLIMAPFKVEEIYREPSIVMIHEVLNDAEIKKMIDMAEPKLVPARVIFQGKYTKLYEEVRINGTAYIGEKGEEKQLRKISQRLADMTALSLEDSMDYHVLKYNTGGFFTTHFDSSAQPRSVEGDDRVATVLLFLNNVTKGGFTVFPLLKTFVKPKIGAALFWHNLHDNGETDTRTLHAGCPLEEGVKWISNKWLTERGQQFVRPCSMKEPAWWTTRRWEKMPEILTE